MLYSLSYRAKVTKKDTYESGNVWRVLVWSHLRNNFSFRQQLFFLRQKKNSSKRNRWRIFFGFNWIGRKSETSVAGTIVAETESGSSDSGNGADRFSVKRHRTFAVKNVFCDWNSWPSINLAVLESLICIAACLAAVVTLIHWLCMDNLRDKSLLIITIQANHSTQELDPIL